MKLEDQVCSLELAKRLKELGVKQESLYWWKRVGHHHVLSAGEQQPGPAYLEGNSHVEFPEELLGSAFTVAELGEMLPKARIDKDIGRWEVFYESFGPLKKTLREAHEEDSLKLADALAKMLVYLIENGLLKPERLAA